MTIENEGQEAPNTVHDDVRAAISQLKEADTEFDNTTDKVAKETTNVDKERNEKGQFNKKEPKPEVKAETVDTEVKTEVKDAKVEEKKLRVPRGLKAHLQQRFTELSPEWQAEIERIDRAGEEGYRKVADRVKYAESIENELKPYEHIFRAEGVDHPTAVRELVRVAALLRVGTPQQKQQWLIGTAQHFGIPLPQGQVQDQGQEQHAGLENHPLLQNLFNEVNTLKSGLQQRQEQEKQAQYGNAYNAVSSFMEEIDENGIPKHPIDPSNEMDLVVEVKALREKHPDWDGRRIMEAAYENFSWKVPELREARLSRQAAEKEAKRKEDESKAIAAKKLASGSLRGSAASTTGKFEDDSVRGLITAQIRSGTRI